MPIVAALALGVPGLASGAPASAAAEHGSAANEVAVMVEVASTIDEQARLRGWLENKARTALGESTPKGRRGALEIDVTGALYDYRITITVRQDGEVVGVPDTWNCECSNEEILNAVAARVTALAGRLDVEEVEETETVVPPVVEEPVGGEEPDSRPRVIAETGGGTEDEGRRPRRARLGAMGSTGVAFITLGVLGMAGGAGLFAYHHLAPTPDRAWGQRDRTDYQTLGIITASSSAGVLVAGALLVGLRNRAPKKKLSTLFIAPALGRRGAPTVTFSGRF